MHTHTGPNRPVAQPVPLFSILRQNRRFCAFDGRSSPLRTVICVHAAQKAQQMQELHICWTKRFP
jgi:hypothetical protein